MLPGVPKVDKTKNILITPGGGFSGNTAGFQYDQHPLIACTSLEQWGFKGINYHWQQTRNYTWNELAGQLYIVEWNELDDLLAVPYAKYILNR